MRKIASKAFTLVELLIVIGIIGLLAVTLLVTLNPAEAQKKTRDTKRVKDMQSLQSVIDQYFSVGKSEPSSAWVTGVNSSSSTQGTSDQPCLTNWLGIDACEFVRNVPVDPQNKKTGNSVGATGVTFQYEFKITASNSTDYEIRTRLESASNKAKIDNDNGNNAAWYEVGSLLTTLTTPE